MFLFIFRDFTTTTAEMMLIIFADKINEQEKNNKNNVDNINNKNKRSYKKLPYTRIDDRIYESKLEITRKRQTEFNNRNNFFFFVFCTFLCIMCMCILWGVWQKIWFSFHLLRLRERERERVSWQATHCTHANIHSSLIIVMCRLTLYPRDY